MKTLLTTAVLVAAALVMPEASFGALPTGKIEFVTPSAIVGPNDVIDVRIRLTLDASSSDLTFTSNPLTGLAAADLPSQGYYRDPVTGQRELRDFVSFRVAYFVVGTFCGTFVNLDCSDSANYSFNFWASSEPGKTSIIDSNSLSLTAGSSMEYVLSQYTPSAAGAAAGVYSFESSSLDLVYGGFDAGGNSLTRYLRLGDTCPDWTPSCRFTRTVVITPVPEPSTYAIFALGLLGLRLHLRRSRAASKL